MNTAGECSIPPGLPTWPPTNHAYQAAALIEDVQVKALNKLADQISLPDEGHYLVVFNPLSHTRTDVVSLPLYASIPVGKPFFQEARPFGKQWATVWRAAEAADRKLHQLPASLLDKPFRIVDLTTGQPVAHQLRELTDPRVPAPDAASRLALSKVSRNSQIGLNYDRNQAVDVVFVADNVPSLGYKVFRIEPLTGSEPVARAAAARPADPLENAFYRVQLNGGSLQIYDKSIGRLITRKPADFPLGQLLTRSIELATTEKARLQHAPIIRHGPVFSSIRLRSSLSSVPQIDQELTLYHSVKRVDVATRLLKDASPLKEYYLSFPFDVADPQYRIRSVNATIVPIADQLPGTHTDAYSVGEGLSVFNDRYTVNWASLEAPVVRLGELWPGYVSQAHHGKTPVGFPHAPVRAFTSSQVYSLVSSNNFRTNFSPSYSADMLFRYSITSHPGPFLPVAFNQHSRSLAQPLTAVVVRGGHTGSLGSSYSFLSISQPNVELVTLKAAEDGNGMILRLAETAGQSARVQVQVNGFAVGAAFRNTGTEEPAEALKVSNNGFALPFGPFETKTVRLRTATAFPVSSRYFYSY